MPTYAYRCGKCEHEYEIFYTSIPAAEREEPTETCPKCDAPEKERLVTGGSGFILKGGGWAKDRYGAGRGRIK